MKKNPLIQELLDLGIISEKHVTPYYPSVWDRTDVSALRCEHSGVIFLDRIDHVKDAYYDEKDGISYWSKKGITEALRETQEDDERRLEMIRNLIINKNYADIGSGLGGILPLAQQFASQVYAVEPQKDARKALADKGFNMCESIAQLAEKDVKFDVITLFHVFEHITEPLKELRLINECLKPGGKVLIEVPHAKDVLLNSYDLETFRKFTLWSEHLVLHTRNSLDAYLKTSGFINISVLGVQRYSLANHIMWLKDGLPGGHMKLPQFRDADAERTYNALLSKLDQNDTLIAIGEKRAGESM